MPGVVAGQSKGLMHFGGWSHLHCPPISSLQRPQGRAQCWGVSQHPPWQGEMAAWGAAKVGVQALALCLAPLSSGAAPNRRAGEGELGAGAPPGRGLRGPPGLGHFPVLPCLRVRRERRREEGEGARAAQWVSPRPSPPAAAGPSGDEVAPVREVSLLLLG